MSSFLHKDVTVTTDELSALHYARHTAGYSRFIYGTYSILSIIFYGIGIYTALGILMSFLNGDPILSFSTVLLLCYVLLNCIIGYGFLFHQKWLPVVFSSVLVLMGLLSAFFIISGMTSRAMALLTSIFMTVGILLFLSLTRRFLSGRYFAPRIIIPFLAVLVCSLLLTQF